MQKVKEDFDLLMKGISELRAQRAVLDAERNSIGAQIRVISETPPNKAELKDIMRCVIEGFEGIWNQKLIDCLEFLKPGNSQDDFISRQVPLAWNENFVRDSGWYALLGHALKLGVDPFVDQLDWPEGISSHDRKVRLAELHADLNALATKIEALDEQFSYMGIAEKEPDKT